MQLRTARTLRAVCANPSTRFDGYGAVIAPELCGAVSMRGESWTPERVETLRKLWRDGETAATIADRLGVMSRSAVLGKIFRLRLPAADTGAANHKPAGAGGMGGSSGGPARRRRGAVRTKRAKPPAAKATRHKTLLELTNTTCRWIVEAAVKWAATRIFSHFS